MYVLTCDPPVVESRHSVSWALGPVPLTSRPTTIIGCDEPVLEQHVHGVRDGAGREPVAARPGAAVHEVDDGVPVRPDRSNPGGV